MVKLRQIKSRFLIIFLLATLGASAINSTYIVKAESNTKTSESVKKNSKNSKGKRSNKEEIKKSKSKADSFGGTGNSSETSLGGFPNGGGGVGSTPTPNKSLLPEEKKKNYVEDNRRRKTDAVIFLSDDDATKGIMSSIEKKANELAPRGQYILVYSSDGLFSFSNKIYGELPKEDKRKFMERAIKSIKESELPSRIKVRAVNFVSEQDSKIANDIKILSSDTSEELEAGYAMFKPFASPISSFLGFISIVALVFLSASFVTDIAYMSNGLVRTFLDRDDSAKPKFVTSYAVEAVQEVDGILMGRGYSSYYWAYMRARAVPAIISLALIGYLISGQIYDIMTFVFRVLDEFRKGVSR